MQNDIRDVPGLNDLEQWFGYLPSFHDAEVVSIFLDRSRPSQVAVHTFEVTGDTDTEGVSVFRKHSIVKFLLEGILDVTLEGFNRQNVLGSLSLDRIAGGYRLTLEAAYGVGGTIDCERVAVEFDEGIPKDSQYLRYKASDS